MLSEAFEWLRERLDEGRRLRIHEVPGDPTHLIGTHGGEHFDIERKPAMRNHELRGLPDLVQLSKCIALDAQAKEVHVGRRAIVLVLDRADRRELATLTLTETTQWGLLTLHREWVGRSVAEFNRLLRYDLRSPEALKIAEKTSLLDFHRQQTATAGAGHGQDTLGATVESKVQKAEEVPETFRVNVAPFREDLLMGAKPRPVELGIFLDTDAKEIALQVLPDELELSIDHYLEAAARWLRGSLGEGTPVFRSDFEMAGGATA